MSIPVQQYPQTANNSQKSSSFGILTVVFVVVALVLGVILGVVGDRYLVNGGPGGVDIAYLPAPIEVLNNPILTDLNSYVEGRLVEIHSDSFTIESDGAKLTLRIHPDITNFYGPLDQSQVPLEPRQKLSNDEIKIGSYLRGGVTIKNQAGGGYSGTQGGEIVANIFTVE